MVGVSSIDDLRGQVRRISELVTGSLRTEPSRLDLAGWGQFLEAASPVAQIGPYGTSAGIVVTQVAFPPGHIDQRVKAQVRQFWEEKPNGKMFPQNVRLAFMVLSLARTEDLELLRIRDEITAVILARQLPDGSWSDAPPHATSPAGGQIDATAWTLLALRRSGGDDAAVHRGALWLAARIEGSGRVPLLSAIGLAAAIAGHPDPRSAGALRKQGFDLLATAVVNREESISFFDYEELKDGSGVQTRDYLCFPAFYPLAVLTGALGRSASVWQAVRLNAFRSEAIRKLNELAGGHYYKNPTVRFSSTVDQAIYALTYEEFAAADAGRGAVGLLVPVYKWSQQSLVVHLVMPVLLIVGLAALMASPTTVARCIKLLIGRRAAPLLAFSPDHAPTLQAFAGIAATLLFGLPRRGRNLFWKKVRRQGSGR